MIRKRGTGLFGAAVLFGLGLASQAFGSPSTFLQPAFGARLEPGAAVDVSWTVDAAAVAGFEESELVLSLDGGRTFPVRLTRDIALSSRHLLWRVPALPTVRARLALRAGEGSQSDSETLVLIGPEFEIAARPSSRLEELFRVGGEWRTRDALSAPHSGVPKTSLDDRPSEQMRSAPPEERPARPSDPAPQALEREQAIAQACRPATPRQTETLLPGSSPLFVPLRQ